MIIFNIISDKTIKYDENMYIKYLLMLKIVTHMLVKKNYIISRNIYDLKNYLNNR